MLLITKLCDVAVWTYLYSNKTSPEIHCMSLCDYSFHFRRAQIESCLLLQVFRNSTQIYASRHITICNRRAGISAAI